MNGEEIILDRKYRLLQRIGEGGMGVVFEAEHIELGKRVAVKILNPQLATSEEVLERFKREARAACKIGHPNIRDVTDIGVSPEGDPFMIMELLRGEPLSCVLSRVARFPLGRVRHILTQVLSALDAAHTLGIMHRDVKPENIFLMTVGADEDFVKVLDFGISKFLAGSMAGENLTQTGAVLGTPRFLSPEQVRGDTDIDARADLFSVGVIAYRMLAGVYPFEGSNYHQLLYRIINTSVRNLSDLVPEVPEEVANAVHLALSKDRGDRPQTAAEFTRLMFDSLDRKEAAGTGAVGAPPDVAPWPDGSSAPGVYEVPESDRITSDSWLSEGRTVLWRQPGSTSPEAAPDNRTMLGGSALSIRSPLRADAASADQTSRGDPKALLWMASANESGLDTMESMFRNFVAGTAPTAHADGDPGSADTAASNPTTPSDSVEVIFRNFLVNANDDGGGPHPPQPESAPPTPVAPERPTPVETNSAVAAPSPAPVVPEEPHEAENAPRRARRDRTEPVRLADVRSLGDTSPRAKALLLCAAAIVAAAIVVTVLLCR